jgi:hypothetical protein
LNEFGGSHGRVLENNGNAILVGVVTAIFVLILSEPIKAGKCKTQLERLPTNKLLFDFIANAEEALTRYPAYKVLKWDTEAWGEIPADFGRK